MIDTLFNYYLLKDIPTEFANYREEMSKINIKRYKAQFPDSEIKSDNEDNINLMLALLIINELNSCNKQQ